MNIQTQAYELPKKPTKKKAMETLEVLYKHAPDDVRHQVAELYKYFQLSTPKKSKNLSDWVNLATSGEETRAHLVNTYCRDGVLYGCDGYRIHMTPSTLKTGFYDPSGTRLLLDYEYPDMKRITPEKNHSDTLYMDRLELDSDNTALIELFGITFKLNLRYLQDIMQNDITANIFVTDIENGSPILFVFDDRETVLMPMRQRSI